MVAKVQIKRTSDPNKPPTGLLPGELAIEMDNPLRLWVGVPVSLDATMQKLLFDGSDTPVDAYSKSESDSRFVNIPGDTMTGQLIINYPNPEFILKKNVVAEFNSIFGMLGTSMRWGIFPGNGDAESGGGVGSNFQINSYDAGVAAIALKIDRTLLNVRMYNDLYIYRHAEQNLGVMYFGVNGRQSLAVDNTGNTFNFTSLTAGATVIAPSFSASGNILCGGMFNGSNINITGTCTVQSGSTTGGTGINMTAGSFTPGTGYWVQTTGLLYTPSAIAYKVGGGPWDNPSDARIKNVTGDYTQGLDAIKALSPKRFTYKGNDVLDAPEEARRNLPEGRSDAGPTERSGHYAYSISGEEFIGLIAQEVEIPMPEMVRQVSGTIDGVDVTDYRVLSGGPLVYALVNAVKELSAEIDALKLQLGAATRK